MKRINLLSMAILAAAVLLVGATSAYAADVSLPSGNYPFYTLAVGGVYEVNGNLTLQSGAKITCNDNATDQPPGPVLSACPITILVHGDLVMEAGSAIQAENQAAGGNGGDISITVDGNVLLKGGVPAGALISSRKLSGAGDTGDGGNITIHAGNTDCATSLQDKGDVTVETGAQILSNGPGNAGDIEILSGRFITIDGRVEAKTSTTVGRGGRITLIACCDLRVGSTGIVSSRGNDPGADLVHLEGCSVEILGLVESTGVGHNDQGVSGPSLCNSAAYVPAHVLPPGYDTFRACVEIWSGSTLLIDASGTFNGQVNADLEKGNDGPVQGASWIDIYANGKITITGNTNEPFAVHANSGLGLWTGQVGGQIAVKSKLDNVKASDLALQADGTANGGQIYIDALNVDLTSASIYARGRFVPTFGKGGLIEVRAYAGGGGGGSLNWPTGTGDVRPTGTAAGLAAANRGIIRLFGNPIVSAASFPNNGAPATTPTLFVLAVAGFPSVPLPANTVLVARLNCLTSTCSQEIPPPPDFCTKAPVRAVLDPVHGRFPGNQGPDHVVRVDLGESIQAELDLAALPGYDAAHNNDGYIIIGVSAHADHSLGGHTNQGAEVAGDYEWPFALFGCSVTMHGPVAGGAVGHITQGATALPPPNDPEGIFIMDLHAADGTTGWFVEGDLRYIRNTYGLTNGTGVWIKGNNNVMHNGNASGNSGVGLKIEGNGNFAGDTDAFSNGSHGVEVDGDGNTISKVDTGDKGKGNQGDGLNLSGKNNTLDEVAAFANKGWGFVVSGGPNTLDSNVAGDKGDKANAKGGFLLSGGGLLTENTAIGNFGGALLPKLGDGFKLTTSGFSLSKNISGGSGSGTPNTGCQFNFGAGTSNADAGGNKSKGAAISGTGSPKNFLGGATGLCK